MRHPQHPARRRPQRLAQRRSDVLLGQLDLDRHAAALAIGHGHLAEVVDQVQHGPVVGQDLGGEAPDPLGAGALRQAAQQRARHAAALPGVRHGHRHLGHLRIAGGAHEARHAEPVPGGGLHGHQRLVIAVVDLGQVAQLRLAQVAGRGEEAAVARLRAEPPHPGGELVPVIGLDRAHDDRLAVAQAFVPLAGHSASYVSRLRPRRLLTRWRGWACPAASSPPPRP